MTSCRLWCRVGMAWLCCAAVMAEAQPAPPEMPLNAPPYSPGLDLSSLDRSVDACVDFYRFSCGGWQQNNPIPADQSSWDVYAKLQDENRRFLWGLLDEAAADRADRNASERRTGDYFAACMDEAVINAAGAVPLQPELARLSTVTSVRKLASAVARLHSLGVGDAMFNFASEQDHADSTRVIARADAGGLGLPDRDHYLARDARSRALREAYREHVARMLQLLGDARPAAEAQAATVMAMETDLARASLTRDQRRDPHSVYHRMSLAQLHRLAPDFDWPAYLMDNGVPAGTPINVAEPAFFRRLGSMLAQRPFAHWITYLRWHLVNARAPYLSQPFARADFDFYSATLRGVQRMPPRWKRCVGWVDRDLGEALGQIFVQRTFAPVTRARAAGMTEAIEEAMQARLRQLDWMSEQTKEQAFAKLRTLVNKVGYPDRWRDYASLEIRRGDFFGNVLRSQQFEWRRQLAKIGRPVDRGEWQMTPPSVNAYYDAQLNSINFPAGILQPPLFDPHMDDAPNYGDTGSTIGHELTHGFDDEGRQFDALGNLRDWWTRKDASEFERRTRCIVDQYAGYTVVDDLKINSRLTLGEDVADLGGTALAYMAWKSMTSDRPEPVRDGFTPEQRFFIGFAQWACSNERPEMLRLLTLTDPHSPSRYRINGVVANMPEFAQAFSCRPGQPMARPKPCKVW